MTNSVVRSVELLAKLKRQEKLHLMSLESISRRDENYCQRVFPLLDRDWCIGLDSQRIVHRLNKNGPSIPVWDCKPPETRSHSHLKSTSARLQCFCVNHIYQLQEYYSATPGAAKLSQKGCGQANAREKPLCITVQSEPRHIFAPCEEQYRGWAWVKVWFLPKCAILSGNWQLSQGNRGSAACINPLFLPTNHRLDTALLHMFTCTQLAPRPHCCVQSKQMMEWSWRC